MVVEESSAVAAASFMACGGSGRACVRLPQRTLYLAHVLGKGSLRRTGGNHRNAIGLAAGAKGDEIDRIAKSMAQEKEVRMDRAVELLKEIHSLQDG